MYAVHTLMIFFRCFCMVSQLRQMIRPNCSRFPGIDLLPNRAPSAFSKSSELLLDLQVGFCTHTLGPRCIFGRSHEFLNSSLILGTKQQKVGFLFWGQIFTSEVVKPTHEKTEGGELRNFPWDFSWDICEKYGIWILNPLKPLVIHPEWKEHPRDHLKQVDPFFLFLWGDSPVHWRSFFGTNCPWVFPSFFDWKSLWC